MMKIKFKHILLFSLLGLSQTVKTKETFGISTMLKHELSSSTFFSIPILTFCLGLSYIYVGLTQQKAKIKSQEDNKECKYTPSVRFFFNDPFYNFVAGSFCIAFIPLITVITQELASSIAFSI